MSTDGEWVTPSVCIASSLAAAHRGSEEYHMMDQYSACSLSWPEGRAAEPEVRGVGVRGVGVGSYGRTSLLLLLMQPSWYRGPVIVNTHSRMVLNIWTIQHFAEGSTTRSKVYTRSNAFRRVNISSAYLVIITVRLDGGI